MTSEGLLWIGFLFGLVNLLAQTIVVRRRDGYLFSENMLWGLKLLRFEPGVLGLFLGGAGDYQL